MNIYLILLIIGNIFIGMGPLFVKLLPGVSPFTIGFGRFLSAAILEFVIIIFIWIKMYRALRKSPSFTSFPKLYVLMGNSLKNYYWGKNRFFLKGKRQFFYLSFLGFLLVGIVVPFFYLSFELVGVILSTILVNSIPILVITLLNWAKRTEEMDGFKIIYLFLLSAGIISITLSYETTSHSLISIFGFLIVITTIIAFILYSVYVGQDSLHRINLISPKIPYTEVSPDMRKYMRQIRFFYKLFGIHFLGSVIFLGMMALLGWLDQNTEAGIQARQFILLDLPHLGDFLINPSILGIAVVCTLIPYMFQVIASGNWPRHELGFDSWNSVLTVIQPLVGLYIGKFLWQEAISVNYVVITSIFLVSAIVIRYLHESANYRLILFQIRIANKSITPLLQYIRIFREIKEVYVTFGRVGIIFHAAFRSVSRLFLVTKKIETFPGVISVKYFPEVEFIPSNLEEDEAEAGD